MNDLIEKKSTGYSKKITEDFEKVMGRPLKEGGPGKYSQENFNKFMAHIRALRPTKPKYRGLPILAGKKERVPKKG